MNGARLLIKNAKALVGTHAPGVDRVAGPAMRHLPQLEQGWLMAENGIITAMGANADWPGITD